MTKIQQNVDFRTTKSLEIGWYMSINWQNMGFQLNLHFEMCQSSESTFTKGTCTIWKIVLCLHLLPNVYIFLSQILIPIPMRASLKLMFIFNHWHHHYFLLCNNTFILENKINLLPSTSSYPPLVHPIPIVIQGVSQFCINNSSIENYVIFFTLASVVMKFTQLI